MTLASSIAMAMTCSSSGLSRGARISATNGLDSVRLGSRRIKWRQWLALRFFLLIHLGTFADLLVAAPPALPPLTTVGGSPRLPGKFVWADLVTDDVLKARKFYGELFGWTFQSAGDYLIAA